MHVPVGRQLLGRVLNPLGEPIDNGPAFNTDKTRPVEALASGVTERKPVNVPMQTGVLSIDSMIPIGRGQRQLIIGDRQTGKTSIAVDAIINQRYTGVLCIYVAIGQKASVVAGIVETLHRNNAMDHTIVVCFSSSDSAPLQYLAPYAACAMAEEVMYSDHSDVLIVYDDLSKHAVAYRTMSLLLKRPPGREAYPGDVFYLHSRLLERAARLSDDIGGGSITALPIIETLAGDISAYIPTNVISITDGQIFLESELFHSGFRPAINVGLSVSRVGGAAQTKAMKRVAGSLRLELAQYRELQVFSQFGSDLDVSTRDRLNHGVKLMETLNQGLHTPIPMEEQVIILFNAKEKFLKKIISADVSRYNSGLIMHFREKAPDLLAAISGTGQLTPESETKMRELCNDYAQDFQPSSLQYSRAG
jgi:F-type H+-transporting ATPase subunit alpha